MFTVHVCMYVFVHILLQIECIIVHDTGTQTSMHRHITYQAIYKHLYCYYFVILLLYGLPLYIAVRAVILIVVLYFNMMMFINKRNVIVLNVGLY